MYYRTVRAAVALALSSRAAPLRYYWRRSVVGISVLRVVARVASARSLGASITCGLSVNEDGMEEVACVSKLASDLLCGCFLLFPWFSLPVWRAAKGNGDVIETTV